MKIRNVLTCLFLLLPCLIFSQAVTFSALHFGQANSAKLDSAYVAARVQQLEFAEPTNYWEFIGYSQSPSDSAIEIKRIVETEKKMIAVVQYLEPLTFNTCNVTKFYRHFIKASPARAPQVAFSGWSGGPSAKSYIQSVSKEIKALASRDYFGKKTFIDSVLSVDKNKPWKDKDKKNIKKSDQRQYAWKAINLGEDVTIDGKKLKKEK